MNKELEIVDIAYCIKDHFFLNSLKIDFKKNKTYIVFENGYHPSIKSELGNVYAFYFEANKEFFKKISNFKHLMIEKI